MMMYNAEQVMNGLISYADSEIMSKLPTTGKWLAGTAIGLATTRSSAVIDMLRENAIMHALGVADENGMIDVDAVIASMKNAADRYGKITIDVPLIGRLSFSSNDVDDLRKYIV